MAPTMVSVIRSIWPDMSAGNAARSRGSMANSSV
jgi:hypothetical protein